MAYRFRETELGRVDQTQNPGGEHWVFHQRVVHSLEMGLIAIKLIQQLGNHARHAGKRRRLGQKAGELHGSATANGLVVKNQIRLFDKLLR